MKTLLLLILSSRTDGNEWSDSRPILVNSEEEIKATHRSDGLGVTEMFFPTDNGNQTVQTSSYIADRAAALVIRVKYV